MLSPTEEGQARGVDLNDITSLRMGILKLWAGELLVIFMSSYIILDQSLWCFLGRKEPSVYLLLFFFSFVGELTQTPTWPIVIMG